MFIFTKTRHFAAPLKEKETLFVKKKRIVDSEFVQKRHEQVNGQIISKGLFGILKFFQKTNEQIRF